MWLVYHKAHSGIESVDYDDSVCEALCFGWVDSLIKRLDADRYARKFTPRKPTSNWSDSNRKRWTEMKAAGLLAAAGKAAAPTAKRPAPPPVLPKAIPTYITTALKANAKAWKQFQALPQTHRREFLMWIHSAKREETRQKRIRETIRLLSAGKKLGLR
ncbi:MAG TPA: YdeI/OmpD-associated family protein [Candidatus Rubrimentiphilum sp.]|nr:YdeI/OmpD-associated family protein [Candidatus Rubrimentiphilum sp.]